MKRIKIIAEASVPYLRGVLEELGEVQYLPSEDFTPETIREADWLIVRSITRCDRALLEGSRVRLITSATIGYDHIDVDYCAEAGITWFNAPGCNAEAVGQYFGAMITMMVLNGRFEPRDKVLGIVGVGHVGRVIERYARALGMKVLRNDPPRAELEGDRDFVSLERLAKEADMITFHTPLTRSGKYATVGLLNDDFVSQLKRSPIIVNACRGAVTETNALIKGLENGKISDVVIDCWENEPNVSKELLKRAYLATPHIAGFSAQGKANGARISVQHGLDYFGLESSKISSMCPPSLEEPMMRLYSPIPLFEALLKSLDLRKADASMRNWGFLFEQLRREYVYPYEPSAYRVLRSDIGAWAEAAEMIGFNIVEG